MDLSPLESLTLITILASSTTTALGVGSYLYFRARAAVKRTRVRRERHLQRLRRLTSKLLYACDHLLDGDTPEETPLYRRFRANGGEYYAEVRAKVLEDLSHSQKALHAAFDLHQKLIDPAVEKKRSLEQQIWDWEMLYAALMGQSERIQNLAADELYALFNPLLVADVEESDPELVRQLKDLRRELTGRPFKVNWQMLHPGQIKGEGILDYVDRIKTRIARLPERHAPEAIHWLAEAQARRRLAQTEVPSFLTELYQYTMQTQGKSWPGEIGETEPVELTDERLFADIDKRLVEAHDALERRANYLDILEQSSRIWQDVETVGNFLQAMADHGRRRAKIDALLAQGYRPPRLTDDLQEIKQDVQTIVERILVSDYSTAAPWIEELNADSRRALSEMQVWQQLREQNMADLYYLSDRVALVAQRRQAQVVPAWQQLQTYPRQNWADLVTEMEQALQTFRRLHTDQINQLESLNSFEVQQFVEAERMLTHVTADLARVEQQFRIVVNRLAEVQTAEARITQALRLTKVDLTRAEMLRDQEDVKIGPEVDRQIEEARRQLAEASRLAESGDFIAAIDVQTTARQLATAAYVSADEQVREINTLQMNLEELVKSVQERMIQCITEARNLPDVAQTDSTNRLGRQLRDGLSRAKQARATTADLEDRTLLKALLSAIAAYDEVNELAGWTLDQLAADCAEYNENFDKTRAMIAKAQVAIRQAERVVRQADASGVGRRALHRAQTILPSVEATAHATREALVHMHQQAGEAARYAKLAENQAKWRYSRMRMRSLEQAKRNLQEVERRAADLGIRRTGANDLSELDSEEIDQEFKNHTS